MKSKEGSKNNSVKNQVTVEIDSPDIQVTNPLFEVSSLIKKIKNSPKLNLNKDFHFSDEKGDFML